MGCMGILYPYRTFKVSILFFSLGDKKISLYDFAKKYEVLTPFLVIYDPIV